MDWGKLLQFLLNYFEKNPQLVESLLTTIINRILGDPNLQTHLVNFAVSKLNTSTIKP